MKKKIQYLFLVLQAASAATLSASVTKGMEDGWFRITVPADETYTLSEADMAEIGVDGNICKFGEGVLALSTNESSVIEAAYKAWKGEMHVSNGIVRLETDYVLGRNSGTLSKCNGGGDTYVGPGASLEVCYSRNEKFEGANGGWIQNERIHAEGKGYRDRGAVYYVDPPVLPEANPPRHVLLGYLDLCGDTWIGLTNYATHWTQFRYREVALNGHTLHVSQGGGAGLMSIKLLGTPSTAIVMEENSRFYLEGSGFTLDAESDVVMQDGSMLQMYNYEKPFPARLHVVGDAKFSVNNKDTVPVCNVIGREVFIDSSLTVEFTKAAAPSIFSNAVYGVGALIANGGGTLTLCDPNSAFRRLEIGRNYLGLSKVALPEGATLSVREFSVNGVEFAPGTYTSADTEAIVSGSVRVSPDAPMYTRRVLADTDLCSFNGLIESNDTVIAVGEGGKLNVSMVGGSAGGFDFTRLTELIASANFHLDATASESIDFTETWTSPETGARGIESWWDVKGRTNKYARAKYWNVGGGYITNDFPAAIRCVRAYATLRDHTVNGVVRPYVDFGELDGKNEENVSNGSASNTTASAMCFSDGVLDGREFHIVHGDAHPDTTGKVTYRNVIGLARTNCGDAGGDNYYINRRGANGELFHGGGIYTTASYYGRIWVDNETSTPDYIPEWDEVNVYTLIPTNAFAEVPSDFTHYNTLACDTYARYGGMRIGELLVYKGATNTAADRAAIDAYLMKKWKNAGYGAEIPFGDVSLSGGVVSFTNNYCEIGCLYSMDSLGGNGTLTVGANDTVRPNALKFGFTSRTVCNPLSVEGGRLAIPESGTISLSAPAHPKAGEYVLLAADSADGFANLANWTVDLSESACPTSRLKLQLEDDALTLYVSSAPFAVIVR